MNLQASDFMNDEAGTKELCGHAAHWLFESPSSMLSTPDQASDQVGVCYIGTGGKTPEYNQAKHTKHPH